MATIPFLQDVADRTGWFTRERLADMIAVSESTPGPIGINMATYAGFETAGLLGAACATLAVVTPGFACILLFARLLDKLKSGRLSDRLFYGLRPASAGLITSALYALAALTLVAPQASGPTLVNFKALALAAAIFALTNFVKPLKELHPLVYIAASAAVGAAFKF